MERIVKPHSDRLQGVEGDRKTFFLNVAVSSICHLLLFAILIFVPDRAWDKKSSLSVINVSIVTLPSVEKSLPPNEQRPVDADIKLTKKKEITTSKIAAKAVPEAIQKPPTAISVKPIKRKAKKSLKKKTFKSSKVVESAIDKIEKRVEESRPDQVNQAIARLKDQVKKTGTVDQKQNKGDKGTRTLEGSGSKRALELIDLYRVEIAYQIQKNWAFSDQLAGGRTDLVAELAFTVMPNGEIRDIWFDKRSGNRYLDDSAKKAIMKSNPVRPHPTGIRRSYVNVGLRFTPKGVE
jgi:colicin import membrane protein